MQRRQMIRLVGGGAVMAAAAASGCSAAYPDEALAAWRGPGDEPDLRRWALGHAILAPSPHNRQPWLVDLREPDAIVLHVDRSRLLPETDPWFRQIMIGQGTFIEALALALRQRGLVPVVTLFPQGEFEARSVDDRPVARIGWSEPGAAAGAVADPLFAQLRHRVTAKVDYDTARTVDPTVLARLAGAFAEPSVRFDSTVAPDRLVALRTLCIDAAKVELLTRRTVMESIALTRVGPAEIARHRDGISLNAPFVRLIDALGGFDRAKPPAEGSAAYRQMMSRFEGHSRTATGFFWLATEPTRRAEVAAGRAYLRVQLRATELGLQVHPMSQAPQEFEEMQQHHQRMRALLLGSAAADARTVVQMFCRVGYCTPTQHSPRRPLDDLLRA